MDTAPPFTPHASTWASLDASRASARACAAGAPPARVPSSLPVNEIVNYIRRNVSRRITLGDIAELAELSVFQLIRSFRRELATTPYRLVVEVRIEYAKSLLTHGASIADAALDAGFADQSHFTRHFKRSTGVTPKKYYAG